MAVNPDARIMVGSWPDCIRESDQVGIVRMCFLFNSLQTLHRSLMPDEAAEQLDAPDARLVADGHRMVLFLLIVGVLKEGGSAIKAFQSRIPSLLIGPPLEPNEAASAQAAWSRVREVLSVDGATHSLWKDVIQPIRDEVSFHWKDSVIKRACAGTAPSPRTIIAVATDGTLRSKRFAFADDLLLRMAGKNWDDAEWKRQAQRIQEFVRDILVVLESALVVYFWRSDCRVSKPLESAIQGPSQNELDPTGLNDGDFAGPAEL